MKKVKFDVMIGGAYTCHCKQRFCPIDHSGTYVLASEAEAEIERIKVENATLRKKLERCREMYKRDAGGEI